MYSIIPQPHSGIPQPHSGIPQPHSGTPQPHSGIPQRQSGIPQPHSGIPQPQSGTPQLHLTRSQRVSKQALLARIESNHRIRTQTNTSRIHKLLKKRGISPDVFYKVQVMKRVNSIEGYIGKVGSGSLPYLPSPLRLSREPSDFIHSIPHDLFGVMVGPHDPMVGPRWHVPMDPFAE
jgi:hypothetical protein